MKKLLSILALLSCSLGFAQETTKTTPLQTPPDNTITYFLLRWSHAPMANSRDFQFEQLPDGKAVIRLEKNFSDKQSLEAPPSFAAELEKIVQQYEISKYKENYPPLFDVRDGTMWSISVRYRDGRSFSSRGHEAYPPRYREMTQAVQTLFEAQHGWHTVNGH